MCIARGASDICRVSHPGGENMYTLMKPVGAGALGTEFPLGAEHGPPAQHLPQPPAPEGDTTTRNNSPEPKRGSTQTYPEMMNVVDHSYSCDMRTRMI
ncbi:hypothetical protein EVAR_41556_1 [Eumeta japonica]|uniref:Uncharacterized protein n=1 Tax=Eumeta variegata TaxID=151549 RepID=A0A4C1XYX3_EUMVA|nr:hypothetical protein EVAR_41556_1 [Eumeta japonica]